MKHVEERAQHYTYLVFVGRYSKTINKECTAQQARLHRLRHGHIYMCTAPGPQNSFKAKHCIIQKTNFMFYAQLSVCRHLSSLRNVSILWASFLKQLSRVQSRITDSSISGCTSYWNRPCSPQVIISIPSSNIWTDVLKIQGQTHKTNKQTA